MSLERNSIPACLQFLKKHSQNLHPNHFFLMDVKLALVQMIAKEKEIKEKELILKQKLCVELINVINVISPGKDYSRKLTF